MDEAEFQRWRAARNRALEALDLEEARYAFPDKDDHFLLMMLHKARYECTDIAPQLRHDSGAWLRAHNCGRMTGTPLLPEGQLP